MVDVGWLSLLTFFPFCGVDWILEGLGVASPYYLLHALHNAAVVVITWPDVVATFSDVTRLDDYAQNVTAVGLVVALHLYHIARYRAKFHYDDWLHHLLMIGMAIPIGLTSGRTPLMGFSLFFSTGLPGGISYASLFLQRNGWLNRMTEKRINTFMNVWIRSPGCAAHAAFACAWALSSLEGSWPQRLTGFVPAALMYWNGQYFMEQAVADYARRRLEEERHEV